MQSLRQGVRAEFEEPFHKEILYSDSVRGSREATKGVKNPLGPLCLRSPGLGDVVEDGRPEDELGPGRAVSLVYCMEAV